MQEYPRLIPYERYKAEAKRLRAAAMRDFFRGLWAFLRPRPRPRAAPPARPALRLVGR